MRPATDERFDGLEHGERSSIESKWDFDAELFDEFLDTEALAAIETDFDGVEPWRRVGDVLGCITGEIDTD